MKVAGLISIGSLALLLMTLGGEGRADNASNQTSNRGSVTKVRDQRSTERKFPVAVPPASEVLSRIRSLKRPPPPVQEKKEEVSPQVRLLRQLMGQGARAPAAPLCIRDVPARSYPGDANQLLQTYNVSPRGVSLAPQWPVGLRQLPATAGQRPVERWPSIYRPRPHVFGGSRLEWGINLKTHRFQPYYRLKRFGITSTGLSLGRGKRRLGQYYRISPDRR